MGKAKRVGHGIVSWSSTERQSDRYGAIVVGQHNFDGDVRVAAHLDVAALRTRVGKRVHITCKIVASRKSGHLGDLHHGIKPSTPKVGEVIDLGVGTLNLEDAGFEGLTAVVLEPGDGRKHFWFDPYKLYRLHDQTVDVFIEATDEAFSPAPTIKAHEDGPESVDVGDGSFQVKGTVPGVGYRIPPDIERLGDGLFVMNPAGGVAGRRRKLEQ